MTTFKNIAQLLKYSRKTRKMSQAKLSSLLGYTSPQIVSNIERGRCSLPLKQLDTIKNVLGLTPDTLINAILADYRLTLQSSFRDTLDI